MRTIEFRTSSYEDKLSREWDNKEYSGEFLGTISLEGNDNDYLVTRVISDDENTNGHIDVRDVAQDYYGDGTYVTYAAKNKSEACLKTEELLNTAEALTILTNKVRADEVLKRMDIGAYRSTLRPISNKDENIPGIVIITSNSNFKMLKESHKNNLSIYELSMKLKEKQEEIDLLNYKMHSSPMGKKSR